MECNRDTTHEWFKCGVEYIVEYGPRRARKSALILGLIEEYRPGGQKLAGANVLLTNVKDQALHYSTVSDNGGRFRFAPPPGIYLLTMSQQGVFDVVVPDFLVPQENDTMVRLQTEKTSAPHFCE